MRALINGLGGFTGGHLAEYLLAQTDFDVWGCGLSPVLQTDLSNSVHYRSIDLRDPVATIELIQEAQPERIYHLAGLAAVHASWEDPWGTLEGNVRPMMNTLEAVRHLNLACRIMVVTSMEVYGQVESSELPLKETQTFRPNSPYGASKVAQDLVGLSYFLSHDMHIVRVRPLNFIGPRQSDQFVATAFARQIARIETGLQSPTLRVGTLSARRDFTDVRDMVRAFYLALEHCHPGLAYNIASGQVYSIQSLLDQLLALTTTQVSVEVDPDRLRASGTPTLVADCTRFKTVTGWRPEIPFETTIRDLLDYERECTVLEKEQ